MIIAHLIVIIVVITTIIYVVNISVIIISIFLALKFDKTVVTHNQQSKSTLIPHMCGKLTGRISQFIKGMRRFGQTAKVTNLVMTSFVSSEELTCSICEHTDQAGQL